MVRALEEQSRIGRDSFEAGELQFHVGCLQLKEGDLLNAESHLQVAFTSMMCLVRMFTGTQYLQPCQLLASGVHHTLLVALNGCVRARKE